MNILELLKQLDWSIYKFAKESNIVYCSAYRICNEKNGETTSVKITKKWLEAEIKNKNNLN